MVGHLVTEADEQALLSEPRREPMTSTIETEDVVARLAAHANSRINNPNEPARQYLLGLVAELRAALSATPIERLREENAAGLRNALLTLADENSWRGFSPVPQIARMRALAHAALNQQ